MIKFKRFLNFKYEVLIMFYLLFELVKYMPAPGTMERWCITPYTLTYEFGFSSRLFIGSILNFIIPHLTVNKLYIFIFSVIIILCILVTLALGRVIKSTSEDYRYAAIILIILFLANPSSISFLFYWGNYGRFDTFLIILTVLSAFLIRHRVLRFCIPVGCFIGIAIHQVYVFTYLIIVFVLLIYEMVKEKGSIGTRINAFVSIAVSGLSFIYFQFLAPHINIDSSDKVMQILQARSNIPVLQDMIQAEYFSTITEQFNTYFVPYWKMRLINGSITIILMLPVIIFFISFWRRVKAKEKNRAGRFVLKLIAASPLCTVPAFLLTIDWGRWFAAIFIVQFFYLFYLLYDGYQPVVLSIKEMQVYMEKSKYLFLLMIVYCISLGKFEAAAIMDLSNKLAVYIMQIISILL